MNMAERLTAKDVFGYLRPDQVNAISEASDEISCVAGETVYERGAAADHLFTLLKGGVALRLPGKDGVSIVIDQLSKGAMFGSCVCFYRDSYALTAQCTEDSELLKIKGAALKDLMDGDLMMGYGLQTRISEIYFSRYIETMKKLQAIVMNIPIEVD
jgi:CRP-like cAMP-binding protein